MGDKEPLEYETPSRTGKASAIAKQVVGGLGATFFAAAFFVSIESPYAPSIFEISASRALTPPQRSTQRQSESPASPNESPIAFSDPAFLSSK
jgi:hypothetical protein